MNCLYWLGNTKTPLKDGDTISSIEVGHTYIAPKLGDVVEYHKNVFVWTGDKWESLEFISYTEDIIEDSITAEYHKENINNFSDYSEEKLWENCGSYYDFTNV